MALAIKETAAPVEKKGSKSSHDRDVVLAEVEKEKKLSFIKAWEETEKSKAENKAQKELSSITAWENTKKADIEAKLKQIEEKYEKKKAEYAEKMKNKVGLIHQQAEEKRAMVVAQKSEDNMKAEELAAKYRATGTVPKKVFGCFGG
ncbi:remorin-like isoform X2 [Bidens hawaiensis]|uniref:remorin-like isoform X2 n=1 Tax=Bidens hawaiensis TaxID=980011 RepID=UPI00404A60BE